MAPPAAEGSVLEKILATGTSETPDGRVVEVHSHIPKAEGEYLQRVVRAIAPKVSLEVGLAFGVSSLYLCEALAEVGATRHTIIDPHQKGIPVNERPHFGEGEGWGGVGLHNLERAGYAQLVEWLNEPSDRALPRLAAEGRRLDFAFLDGWHTFDAVMVEFYFVDQMLNVGGVVAFDDLSYPAIRKLIRFILRNRPYEPFLCDPPARQGALTTKILDRPILRRTLRSEVRLPDSALGIHQDWIALRKIADTNRGDGREGSQRWDAYTEF